MSKYNIVIHKIADVHMDLLARHFNILLTIMDWTYAKDYSYMARTRSCRQAEFDTMQTFMDM